jgi:auxin efflux carrier family protein
LVTSRSDSSGHLFCADDHSGGIYREASASIQSDSLALGQTPSQPVSRLHWIWRSSVPVIQALFTPASMSTFISLLIAIIRPLKDLFVPVPNSGIPNVPDGLPPLSFLLDAVTFIGGASVRSFVWGALWHG